MSRRLSFGRQPDGTIDFRVSRPGFDAALADVNDVAKISFAASRGPNSRVVQAGQITAVDTAASIGTWTEPPPLIFAYNDAGAQYLDNYDRYTGGTTFQPVEFIGTSFVAVISTTTITMRRCVAFSGGTPPAMPPVNFMVID